MSSRAHRPADEVLADFAASERPALATAGSLTRAAAGIPSDDGDGRLGAAAADDVISSERKAPDVSAGAPRAVRGRRLMPFWNLFWLVVPAVVLLGVAVLRYRQLDPKRREHQDPQE